MEHQSVPTMIGFLGVSLLLLAFFLNLFKFVRSEAYVYIVLNFVGGALACYSSYLIDFMPFVVLEGTWSAVAAVALIRRALGHPALSGHG
jgi:hypothetical protein